LTAHRCAVPIRGRHLIIARAFVVLFALVFVVAFISSAGFLLPICHSAWLGEVVPAPDCTQMTTEHYRLPE